MYGALWVLCRHTADEQRQAANPERMRDRPKGWTTGRWDK